MADKVIEFELGDPADEMKAWLAEVKLTPKQQEKLLHIFAVMIHDVTLTAQEDGRDEILELLRMTRMQHGSCQPREHKACTACNAQEQIDAILSKWKGRKIRAS